MSGERPLRVAIFGESYLPYLSGVTVSTETLARGLVAAGHEVLLLAPRPVDGSEPDGAGARGASPAYAWLPSYQPPPPAPPGYRMPWPVPSAALRTARDFAPDVVHAQSPFVSGLMARRVAQAARVPLVFTHHTRFDDYGHYLGPLAPVGVRVMAAYLKDYWAGCAAVVAPGSELAAQIRERLGPRPRPVVSTIPTGIDVGAIRALAAPDVRRQHGWPANALVVVSLGRLAPEKNVTLLVEAFALAAAHDERLRLLMIGGGPSASQIAVRAQRPDLAGRVALIGPLPRLEAIATARGGDLFAFTSQTETQALVLAEALTAGLPVVALAGPGVGDSVRSGVDGLVIAHDANDGGAATIALATALEQLAADEGRRTAMAAAAVEGSDRFDIGLRIGEMTTLYRTLLT